mmetsp:Transcript_21154/g.65575  ORF Transcript_21154/g.65575 Transcript_21154/m.65575 type:complete len:204 (+) Transcript_21154:348-959(+)
MACSVLRRRSVQPPRYACMTLMAVTCCVLYFESTSSCGSMRASGSATSERRTSSITRLISSGVNFRREETMLARLPNDCASAILRISSSLNEASLVPFATLDRKLWFDLPDWERDKRPFEGPLFSTTRSSPRARMRMASTSRCASAAFLAASLRIVLRRAESCSRSINSSACAGRSSTVSPNEYMVAFCSTSEYEQYDSAVAG